MARRSFAVAAAFFTRVAGAPPVGHWSDYTSALPASQLPQVPLLGNGHLGVALDSHRTSSATGVGPGSANSVDVWLNTNSMWSCSNCGGTDPDHTVPACCGVIALGGVSLRFTSFPASAPLPQFEAYQAVSNATLTTVWTTAAGGRIVTTTWMHPSDDIVVTNITWTPSGGDPPSLAVDVATWTLGQGSTTEGSGGMPVPAATGCASPDGARESCSAANAATLVFASRNASTVNATVMPISAALATGVWLGLGAMSIGARVVNDAPVYPPTLPFETVHSLSIPGGSWAAVVVAEAETRGVGLADPVPLALAALAAALAAPQAAIASAAMAWWADMWSKSAVSLPTSPEVEAYWWGAQYALACASATESSEDKPPPGLYGPWASQDGPNWHGDFTLDYNFAAPYYGVFSSNRGETVEAYWLPIIDWMRPAAIKAQVQAGMAHVTCPPNALYFDCHLAPWGLASPDSMLRYMTWNGPHAVLAFVNLWEYTQNATFARDVVYPVLDGMNAWWSCYLNQSAGVWDDENAFNPDYEHEGQPRRNPQIAMALVARTVASQLDIARELGITPPSVLVDIAANLAPFNTININATGPINGTWIVNANTRCVNDIATWFDVADYNSCEQLCLTVAACRVFSYCPPADINNSTTGCPGNEGQPPPKTCWAYPEGAWASCMTNSSTHLGWASGLFNATSPPSGRPATVWTAFSGANVAASDWFATYPSWPTEFVEPLSPWAPAGTAGIAQASSVTYSDFINGRPVDTFAGAVRAGTNASAPLSWTPSQVMAGLKAFLAHSQGPSLLPYAPGGGIENTGISRAVNDMLLQSYRVPQVASALNLGAYVLSAFPFWDPTQSASFTTLLAKGGFTVSASFVGAAAGGAVASPVIITARYTLLEAPSARCSILSPWADSTAVAVSCGGATIPVVPTMLPTGQTALSFDAPAGVACAVAMQ
jgi:hypothetical protein